jgi:hypothetical protein
VGRTTKRTGNADDQFPSRYPDSHGEQDLVSGVQVIKCPAEGDDGVLAVHLERRGVGRCVWRGDYRLARWTEGGNRGDGYGGVCGKDAEVDVCGRRVLVEDILGGRRHAEQSLHVLARAWAAKHVTTCCLLGNRSAVFPKPTNVEQRKRASLLSTARPLINRRAAGDQSDLPHHLCPLLLYSDKTRIPSLGRVENDLARPSP